MDDKRIRKITASECSFLGLQQGIGIWGIGDWILVRTYATGTFFIVGCVLGDLKRKIRQSVYGTNLGIVTIAAIPVGN